MSGSWKRLLKNRKEDKQKEEAYVMLEFDNLGCGSISAIKFEACGFNSFGDVVLVHGQEKFFSDSSRYNNRKK